MTESWRDRLRAVPVFSGELPVFDTDAAPAAPLPLLAEWLESALVAGVSQPHAMTLATADAAGESSARTLLLKDLDDEALWFASLSESGKGRDLARNPRAAVVLYWREQGRQVRVAGDVEAGPDEAAAADFLQRSLPARVMAIASRQSDPMPGEEQVQRDLASARELVSINPNFVPPTWTAYRLVARTVEFWQASRARDQVRLRYRRGPGGWAREVLWP